MAIGPSRSSKSDRNGPNHIISTLISDILQILDMAWDFIHVYFKQSKGKQCKFKRVTILNRVQLSLVL